ncbi:MAG: hypothetical protein IH899_20295 [Planctomycetes bacterium]|nr:hypothetical protein [Planctomycetota bacterium]
MQQVKLFKSVEAEISELETEVNNWIRESGVRVVSIQGNIAPQTVSDSKAGTTGRFSPSDVLIVVTYETPE